MNFYERINFICENRGEKLTPVLKKLGISTGSTGRWKSGTIPNGDTLLILADYFNVSTDYLLCKTNDPTPSVSDEDIARLYTVLIEAGIVKQGEDLTDKQLAAVGDVLKANSDLIRKIVQDYYSGKG